MPSSPIGTYLLECKVSGVGRRFTGTFREAILAARKRLLYKYWKQVIRTYPENERIAEVWNNGEWIREDYKHVD